MRIQNYKIKLKNIEITPFEKDKLNNVSDVMYLYYDLEIKDTDKNKFISFNAYDCPTIDKLPILIDSVDNTEHMTINGIKYSVLVYDNFAGLEHDMRLEKLVKDKECWYNLHIYETFGKSVYIDCLSKKDFDKIVDYVDKKIKQAINNYKKEDFNDKG